MSELIFSEEQKNIANALEHNKNVIVDAVAGSGKTTAIIHIGQRFPKQKILALLYNKVLADESRQKIDAKCSNIEVRTIHSCAQKYYKVNCKTDEGILAAIDSQKHSSLRFDIIIVDEAQDLNHLTAKFIHKLITDNGRCSLLFMGDYRQCIYQHTGADYRYLCYADQLFSVYNNQWEKLTLSKTYRCSKPIATFVNSLLGYDRMTSARTSGFRVKYIIANCFPDFKHRYALGDEILKMIRVYKRRGYSESDIVILAPSVRSASSPTINLVNYLSQTGGLKIYKPSNDDEELKSSDLQDGKIICSTIHQFKGRERRIVIVMNFDESLFKYYSKNSVDVPESCPNRIYVAATRAIDILIVINHCANMPFRFMGDNKCYEEIVLEDYKISDDPKDRNKENNYSVCELIRHLPFTVEHMLKSLYTVHSVASRGETIELNRIVQMGKCKEDVSSIYGTVIPFIKYARLFGARSVTERISSVSDISALRPYRSRCSKLLKKDEIDIQDWAFLANFYNCALDKYIHRLNQINSYSWILTDVDNIDRCIERLDFVTSDGECEREVSYEYDINGIVGCVKGAIDYEFDGTIWEFKCVSSIDERHILQLVVYACIDIVTSSKIKKYKLLNILDENIVEVRISSEERAREILHTLIIEKSLPEQSDDTVEDLENKLH